MAILATLAVMRTRVFEHMNNQTGVWTNARVNSAVNEALQWVTGVTKCLSSVWITDLKMQSGLATSDARYYGRYYLPSVFLELRPEHPVLAKTSATGDWKQLEPYAPEDLFSEDGNTAVATTDGEITNYMVYRDAGGYYLKIYPTWNGSADISGGLKVYHYVLHDELTADGDGVDIRIHLRPSIPFLAAHFLCISRRELKDADYYWNKAMQILEPFITDKDSTTDHETTMGLTRIDGSSHHRLMA